VPTVALIGPDGAGKTTLARQLEQAPTLRCRYLYMGVSIGSSNIALPTSRVLLSIKRWRRRPAGQHAAGSRSSGCAPAGNRRGIKRRLRSVARLANLAMEVCYRRVVSSILQARGFTIVYDRHYLFDYGPQVVGARGRVWENRARGALLQRLLPQPDLVIFLDAPGDVLFARKGELTVVELERRRQGFVAQGQQLANFVRIDATQPQQEVLASAVALLSALRGRRRRAEWLESRL
jgi:thymidylate kinase